jgi:hypothetical protein
MPLTEMPFAFQLTCGSWRSHANSPAAGYSRRLVIAFLTSVLLHIALLFGYLQSVSIDPFALVASPDRLVVTLSRLVHDSSPPAPDLNEGLAASSKTPHSSQANSNAPPLRPQGLPSSELTTRPNEQSVPIDLEAARETARHMARAGSPGRDARVEDIPLALEHETPLGKAIARSSRADCRNAYSGAGLFAIPFLISDAIRDKGCKW